MYVINGASLSDTINNKKNTHEIVKALKWLELFWIYIEINFILSESKRRIKSKNKIQFPNIFFSLSIFQGSEEDKNKHQVFRAEWDNRDNEKDYHPQPHWHFHYRENLVSKFDEDTRSVFDQKEINIINFTKFHFAMNGQWANLDKAVHKRESEDQFINWFSGIIIHIRNELVFLKKKSNNLSF